MICVSKSCILSARTLNTTWCGENGSGLILVSVILGQKHELHEGKVWVPCAFQYKKKEQEERRFAFQYKKELQKERGPSIIFNTITEANGKFH